MLRPECLDDIRQHASYWTGTKIDAPNVHVDLSIGVAVFQLRSGTRR